MGKRDTHTHSKYQSLYEKSIESALINKKIRQNHESLPSASTTDGNYHLGGQKKSPKSKRKMSEYNKFIKENSDKVTGPDRLKKLSKLWKCHKNTQPAHVPAKLNWLHQLSVTPTLRPPLTMAIPRERRCNVRLKSRKQSQPASCAASRSARGTTAPTIDKNTKPKQSPKRRPAESKRLNKSPMAKKSRSIKKRDTEKPVRSVKKDRSRRSPRAPIAPRAPRAPRAPSPTLQRRLRFFNYIGSPKSNQKPS